MLNNECQISEIHTKCIDAMINDFLGETVENVNLAFYQTSILPQKFDQKLLMTAILFLTSG